MKKVENILLYGDYHYANKKSFWEGADAPGSDSEKQYKRHMKSSYQDMLTYGWVDSERKITYEYNTWGFRSDEFTETGGIMFLGCSYVVGVGLPVTDTFSHIVVQRLGLPVYRMGVSGSSNDASFRIAKNWIPIIKPKHVVMLITFGNRLELIDNKCLIKIRPKTTNKYTHSAYYKNFITTDSNSELLKEKNTLAIQSICSQNNANFVSYDYELNIKILDYARDLDHPGVKSNMLIADIITDMLLVDKEE